MSDWGATHSLSIMQGLDMEMPSAHHSNEDAIKAGIKAGVITEAAVDDSIFRILLPMFAVGVMDEPSSAWDSKKLEVNATSEASVASARSLSAKATALLKNDNNILPLEKDATIAVIGFGDIGAVNHGGGSGNVVPSFVATPLSGIRANSKAVAFSNGTDIAVAASLAKDAEYAIVFVGTISHEGADRLSLSFDDGCEVAGGKDTQCTGNAKNQNALVAAIVKAQPKTIVVASIPGATLMPWSKDVPAILTNFMPGQQAGNAIADVLFGHVNPSSKLTFTIPNRENEMNFTTAQWPGAPDPKNPAYAEYSEKLEVGYRYYEAHNIQFDTGFPFGHGLSYTKFKYEDLQITTDKAHFVHLTFRVRNVGQRAGSEVAQLYLTFPASAGEPPNQLKGFRKTGLLQPDEEELVTLTMVPNDYSIWDVASHSFQRVTGNFQVRIGASSRDLRLTAPLELQVADQELIV
jgi:beta-glucosidase